MKDVEQLQKAHYDRIAADYAAHYGDRWGNEYRRRFFNEPLLNGIDLQGRPTLEAMCGEGSTTEFLLERGAKVIGLDISAQEIESFERRWPQCEARCASILDTSLPSESFDCVVVVGGLHHVHPHVVKAIQEIWRVLRPGGHFCFIEPHHGSLPDTIRRFWYRRDNYFAANEQAIDLQSLRTEFGNTFEFVSEEYKGNIAYLLVLNSLIFRVPLWLKPLYAPALISLERLLSPLLGKRLSCFAVSQWRKRVEPLPIAGVASLNDPLRS